MIPKIIHQIWIGPSAAPTERMQTWEEKHRRAGWAYMRWDEEALARFRFENQAHIEASGEWCGKTDIMRYEILHTFGGVFCDADSVCLRPLDDFFAENDSFACWENEQARPGLIANGFLGASRRNRLMRLLIDEIERMPLDVVAGRVAWQTTGPVLLTQAIARHGYDACRVYPSHYFLPVHHTGVTYQGDGVSYASHSWGSAKNEYARFVAQTRASAPSSNRPGGSPSDAGDGATGTAAPRTSGAAADAKALVARAAAARERGAYSEALEAIERSLSIDEGPEALLELVRLCDALGDDAQVRQVSAYLTGRYPSWAPHVASST